MYRQLDEDHHENGQQLDGSLGKGGHIGEPNIYKLPDSYHLFPGNQLVDNQLLGENNKVTIADHNNNNFGSENNTNNNHYQIPNNNYLGNQLNDEEMDLPEEQSADERQSNENMSRYVLRQGEVGVGFLRKLDTAAYGRKSIIRTKIDQLYDTLDEKAQLQNQFKTLAQYERKIDVHPNANGEGKAVILIKWNKTHNMFELNDQAIEAFTASKDRKESKMSFVSVVGDKTSGKTYLFNQILEISNAQEKLPNSNNVSNALVMWSEPIYDAATDCEVYFLDLQLENDVADSIKEKLFFFQCILSNVLVVNMKSNNLKTKDLQCLQPLLKMQDYFEFENLEFKEELKYLMPSVHIVMRDFAHEIKQKGLTLSGQQYLESYLFDELAFQQASESEKKLRRRFIKYFHERDLTTMVRPIRQGEADAEKKLKNLSGVNGEEIDEVFLKEIVSLRKKILQKSDVQSIRGLRFSKSMTIQYIQSFLEDANSNEKFDIDKAISILLENEFISVYHDCVELYKSVMESNFGEAEFMSLEDMTRSLQQAKEQVYFHFFKLKAHDVEIAEQFFTKYYDLLKQFIIDMEAHFQQINNEETHRIVSSMIKQKVELVQQKTKNNNFRIEDIDFIKNQFEIILNSVKTACVGHSSNYAETYGIFVTQIQKIMMDNIVKEIQNVRQQNSNQLKDLKTQKEQQLKKLEQIKNDNKVQNKQIEDSLKEKNNLTEELSKTKKQEDAKQSQGKNLSKEIEDIKWLTGRYNQALKNKTC